MKLKLVLIFGITFLFLFKPASTKENISLKLFQPSEKEPVELFGKPLYVIGMVSPSGSRVFINGSEANVDEDGAFLCYAPIIVLNQKDTLGNNRGKFIIRISEEGRIKQFERYLWVKLPPQTTNPENLEIDTDWGVTPSQNINLPIGENVNIELKATPGCSGYFTVTGINQRFPLIETSLTNSFYWGDAVFGDGFRKYGDLIKGIYKGSFTIDQRLSNSEITVYLNHPILGNIRHSGFGRISSLTNNPRRIIQTQYDPNLIVGRTSPGGGYKLFLPEGIRFEVTGKMGSWYRAKLSEGESIYLSEYSVYTLPYGTPSPETSIRVVRTRDTEKYVWVEFELSEKIPFNIIQHEDPQRIELLLYNTTSDIDWVFFDKQSEFIKDIKHSQIKDGVVKFDILLNQKNPLGL